MPNGDTQMQYPFPYKNSGNDISVSPNATFVNFDTVNLNVSNNASIGGILSCVNINSTGIISAQTATFGQTINSPVITSISNFSLGISASAQLDVINSASTGSFGIGGVNNSQFPNTVFIKSTTGVKLEAATNFVISIASTPQIDFSTATGTSFLTVANFPNLTASTILGLDGSKNVVSNSTTGSGNVVLSNNPTFTGTAQFNSLTSLNPILFASGGTGLSTLGTAGQVLTVNALATALEYTNAGGIATITGSTNINVTAGANPVVSLTGIVPIANGGTALGVVGSNGQILQVVAGVLTYVTPPFVSSVAQTVPAFLSITGSPITSSGTLAIGLSGSALPTTSGGTGLITLGTANQILAVNGGGTALTYITNPALSSVGIIVPAFLNTTGSPLTSNGDITIGFSGTALPVLNGGTGVTTSTGTGATVLNVSPSFTTPSIGAATGTSLDLSPLGTSTTNPITSFQASLAVSNITRFRLGVSSSACVNLNYNNTASPSAGISFDNSTDALELTTTGLLSLTASTGGFVGNVLAIPPLSAIGHPYGVTTTIANGSYTDRSSTTLIVTSGVTALTTETMDIGSYQYTFDGDFTSSLASSVVTFTAGLAGVTIKTRVQRSHTGGASNCICFCGNFNVTVASSNLVVSAISTTGVFSNCVWNLNIMRSG